MTRQEEEIDQIKSQIEEHLVTSGNYDIISKYLKLQLYESGWFDKVSRLATNELQSNKEDLMFDDLFAHVKPKAEEMVPQKVRDDVTEKIKDYLDNVIQ